MSTNETAQAIASEVNALLRGELSAVETYKIATKEIKSVALAPKLRAIASEHSKAASTLRAEVQKSGEKPAPSSGPWGTFAKTVTGAATALGDKAILKALKEGEEHGLNEYNSVLAKSDLDGGSRDLLRSTFIPQQRAHIQAIDAMIATLH